MHPDAEEYRNAKLAIDLRHQRHVVQKEQPKKTRRPESGVLVRDSDGYAQIADDVVKEFLLDHVGCASPIATISSAAQR